MSRCGCFRLRQCLTASQGKRSGQDMPVLLKCCIDIKKARFQKPTARGNVNIFLITGHKTMYKEPSLVRALKNLERSQNVSHWPHVAELWVSSACFVLLSVLNFLQQSGILIRKTIIKKKKTFNLKFSVGDRINRLTLSRCPAVSGVVPCSSCSPGLCLN